MPLVATPLATIPLAISANSGARQLQLPLELAPDLAAGEEGVSKFVLQHSIGRESFARTLTPKALTLWSAEQSSVEDLRTQIAKLEQERVAQPGLLATIWHDTGDENGVGTVGLILGAVGGASLHFTILNFFMGPESFTPGLVILGGTVNGFISGLILGSVMVALKIGRRVYPILQETHAKFASEIAARQELIRGYKDFLANDSQALAEHPEIYDDYLKHCLDKIDTKIGDIKSRRDGFTRELADIQTRRDTTATREFNDESLRAVALSGLDDDAERVRQSIAQLEQWEVVLNGLKGAYEGYREAYSGKLKSYRAKLDDVNYMRSLSIKSKGTHDAIAKAEAQIRADLVELVAMIQTTRELEARQLAAIEVELAGT